MKIHPMEEQEMSERFSGKVDVTDANSNVTITFDGGNGDIIVGSSGKQRHKRPNNLET
jgi:hypothetical protein